MIAALVLVDLQNDYLAAAPLQPAAGQIVERAARLLTTARHLNLPIAHVLTTVTRTPDNRMPHWKSATTLNAPAGRWICEQNTPGHAPPASLLPLPVEPIIDKQFFSGFDNPALLHFLQKNRCDTLILAGVHLHACVRATALDAYRHGFSVLIAHDATGSDDPVHAAITRRYLNDRTIHFAPTDELITLLHNPVPIANYHLPIPPDPFPSTSPTDLSTRASALKHAWTHRPATTLAARRQTLRDLAYLLTAHETDLAPLITRDIAKPITMAHAEVRRSVALLHAIADHASLPDAASPTGTRYRYLPLGVTAIITPWNNPLAIPVGKIAAALVYDNAVLWKPAPPATHIAHRLLALWKKSDPAAPLEIISGTHHAATALAQHRAVDALSLSGSLSAGYALTEIAVRRFLPYQAELGGNNAALIAPDADLSHAAREIASGAFGFAGQRCTANRRAILIGDQTRLAAFVEALTTATRNLPWGDPADPRTIIGPVISYAKCDQLHSLIARAQADGLQILRPHSAPPPANAPYFPPTLVSATDPAHEIVQEESFGPILVIQTAPTFDHALALLNAVRQGLAAALFSTDPHLQRQFLAHAHAGILKLNTSTSDADASSPFGGWKASGIGPAEHGPADREFFTRVQTLYGLPEVP